jgi:hypothetical protein
MWPQLESLVIFVHAIDATAARHAAQTTLSAAANLFDFIDWGARAALLPNRHGASTPAVHTCLAQHQSESA